MFSTRALVPHSLQLPREDSKPTSVSGRVQYTQCFVRLTAASTAYAFGSLPAAATTGVSSRM